MKTTALTTTLAICACASVYGQMTRFPGPQGFGMPGEAVKFVATEFATDAKVIKGAPYSAQATVISTQTLADGNKIVNKSSTFLARDREGRTRREQTIASVGPWTTGQSPVSIVFINDVPAQTSYILDPSAHTARKSVNAQMEMALMDKIRAETRNTQATPGDVKVFTRTIPDKVTAEQEGMNVESLGTKVIEGVQAEGKLFKRTIPAGKIGNERPLVIVNEVWTSPELHAVVMSRHVDPQAGETLYTLTNIQLAEPDPALFSVPADYTVTDAPRPTFVQTKERREK